MKSISSSKQRRTFLWRGYSNDFASSKSLTFSRSSECIQQLLSCMIYLISLPQALPPGPILQRGYYCSLFLTQSSLIAAISRRLIHTVTHTRTANNTNWIIFPPDRSQTVRERVRTRVPVYAHASSSSTPNNRWCVRVRVEFRWLWRSESSCYVCGPTPPSSPLFALCTAGYLA